MVYLRPWRSRPMGGAPTAPSAGQESLCVGSRQVTIVSGLPRSGTSLMMQMLDAGGLPALTDSIRAQDDDNPRGYFELEAVKRTRNDPSWLDEARGRVV